jgi:hypothetical protein
MRDIYGCHSEPSRPLSESMPQQFGAAPGPIPHCPWRVIRDTWDPWLGAVVDAASDIAAGQPLAGWPDDYSAAFVDAVRYLRRESDAAQAKAMESDG